ncbi:hypothetical protein BDQ12DRAFT_674945 [Crucibulum laeve]|uniref:Uncharacterized protein n=1 Tax=Crucibulum laeve TaxID=68775 RepID=A0A5C3MHJ5_9AGAR|nr:hypothetical protein BDQ12DRAFT_674945 [Crucibulum laeve]
MELPSSRELELESLLRERDSQLTELTDEVTRLRQYLSVQAGPSTSDPVSLPPALVSVLLPHLNGSSSRANGASSSNTVTAALTQRAKALQEENDELYELLKHGETGKLKEEVRGLRRIVEKLEGALRESHQVIGTLSKELDTTFEALASSSRQVNTGSSTKSHSHSPRNQYHQTSYSSSAGNSQSKLPPTGPRAHKKPRLSESTASPPPRNSGPPHKSQNHNHSHSNHFSRSGDSRDSTRHGAERKTNHSTKMEVDEDQRARPTSPSVDRNRERGRDHERDTDQRSTKGRERSVRDKERDRDGNKFSSSHRNGNGNGNGAFSAPIRGAAGAPGRRSDRDRSSNGSNHLHGTDRTLAERMGL